MLYKTFILVLISHNVFIKKIILVNHSANLVFFFRFESTTQKNRLRKACNCITSLVRLIEIYCKVNSFFDHQTLFMRTQKYCDKCLTTESNNLLHMHKQI